MGINLEGNTKCSKCHVHSHLCQNTLQKYKNEYEEMRYQQLIKCSTERKMLNKKGVLKSLILLYTIRHSVVEDVR